MKFREIKHGMVIHCKNSEEKNLLLEEAERLGYVWYGTKGKPTERSVYAIGDTIHFYDAGTTAFSADYKHITHSSCIGDPAIEFSDLIIPEMSAEEVLQLANEICKHTDHCADCPMRGSCYKAYDSDKGKTVEVLSKWKSDHEKKEPEIEWFYKAYVDNGIVYTETETEQEAIEWCENYVKEHTQAKCSYKRVCRIKAVE